MSYLQAIDMICRRLFNVTHSLLHTHLSNPHIRLLVLKDLSYFKLRKCLCTKRRNFLLEVVIVNKNSR